MKPNIVLVGRLSVTFSEGGYAPSGIEIGEESVDQAIIELLKKHKLPLRHGFLPIPESGQEDEAPGRWILTAVQYDDGRV